MVRSFIASRPICGWCGFLCATSSKCACKAIHYCDSICQRRHWSPHKVTCIWRAGRMCIKTLSRTYALDELIAQRLMACLG